MAHQVVKIAQAVAGTGGVRVTFKVPEDAPEQCGVEFCIHEGEGDAIDRLASLAPVPVGAPDSLGGNPISIRGRTVWPCEPGKVYRATIKSPEVSGGRTRIVGRIAGQ